ncbi:hypothetical protein COU95_02525 [Candidatus Shapirobacteria bacterium CG10_big_fil_rev_8_21_14_0_10_40_9]|uniref:HTH cro/C1-type domain-containing protein n=1 Tax=Candidatus Shapirobacteria bacterium CG10_big_fil_rev_8_21_14_0_10_40_9 TaxID=1974888 RepID=A0A2M8L3B6_9BACT|nr:MAG: hypothetical protein COU95_02525 [Candidatus Shapirobacteria bacterium CG10_big_fil_rev_8_21_14_0_10_40_9]
MRLEIFTKKLLKDPRFRKEYYKRDLAFEIAQMLIEARIIKGITQARLAKMVGTKQPSIARTESGNYLPSLSFLKKIADVLKTYLTVRFGFMDIMHKQVSNFPSAKNTKEILSSEKWPSYLHSMTISYIADKAKSSQLSCQTMYFN